MNSLKKDLIRFGIMIPFLFLVNVAFAQMASGIKHTFSVTAATPPAFPGGATNVVLAAGALDESVTLVSPVGWTFNFAGVTYGKVAVSSNGWLVLLPAATITVPASVVPLPTNALNNNTTGYPLIAPAWDDLSTQIISHVVAGNVLWVRWSMRWDKNNPSLASLFYVALDGNNNTITIHYANNAAYATTTAVSGGASVGIAGACPGDFYSVYATAANAAYVDSVTENTSIGTSNLSPNFRPNNVSYTFTPASFNDNCATAEFLGTINGTCTNVTSSTFIAGVAGAGNCATSDDNDVWFTYYKPVGAANIKILTSPATCQSVSGTSVEVYDACGGTMIGCAANGTINPTYGEVALSRNSCIAETLYVRVTADGDVPGKFRICAQDQTAAVGNTCANANAICFPLPYHANGLTTSGFGNDYVDSVLCTSSYMLGQDYVFSFTPPVTACFTFLVDGTGANSFPGLFITDGCPDDTVNSRCVASDVQTSNSATITNLTLIGGHTYYIVVDNDSLQAGFGSIPFNLHVTNSASAAPPYDNCGSAASLGSVAFNATCTWSSVFVTNCATPSPVGGYPDPGCGGFSPSLTNDVWFTFTPTFTGIIQINSQGAGLNPAIHGGLAVYTGTCGLLSLVACAGDSVAIPFMPSLSINVTSTTIYYIRFWTAPGFDPGGFQLCFQSNCSPPNDLPVNAIALPFFTPTLGDNTCSTGTGEPPPLSCTHDGTNIPNTVWYKITVPPSGQVAVRLSQVSLVDVAAGAYLFPSGPANAATSYTQLDCNDDIIFKTVFGVCGMTGDNDAALLFTAAPGATVYICVDGAASWTGSFYITAIDGTAAGPWPPLYRRDCANPEFICANSNYSLPNGGIGSDGNICDFIGMSCAPGATRSEVGSAWFQFTVAAGSQLGFTISPNDTAAPIANYNFFLWDVTGGTNICNQLTSTAPIRCNTAAGTGRTGLRNPTTTLFGAPVPAQGTNRTYLLYVENQTSANDDENVPGTNTGFVLNWDIYSGGINIGSTNIIGTSPSSTWSGAVVNTDYQNLPNWKGVGTCPAVLPSCTTDVFISPATQQCWVTGNSYAKNLTINAGGTLRLAAGANLHICGDYVNNGTLIAVPTSTITFEGPAAQSISGALTGANAFANLVINKGPSTGSVTLQANLDVNGSFTTFSTSSIFNINGRYMKVGENFSNNNGGTTFTGIANSTVEFIGTNRGVFSNTLSSITLNKVVMNKTGPAGKLHLSGANSTMNIDSALTLTSGYIVGARTVGAPEVNMKYYLNTSISGYSASSFIDGKLRRKIATPTPSSPPLPASYDFPVGDSLTPGGYNNANITFISSTLVNYLIAYFQPWPAGGPPNGPVGPMECIFADYSTTPMLDNGYWTFERPVTPSNGIYNVVLNNTGYTNNGGNQGFTVAKANTGAAVNLQASWGLFARCNVTSTINATKRDSLNAPAYPGSFNHYYATAQTLSPLPIELLYFTAEPEGENVICKWETASETNNAYFNVERSLNGIEYESIGQVDGYGMGTSTEPRNYSLLDNQLCKDIVYYRLKQVDIDGKYSYSDPVAVNCKDVKTDLVVHPNPAQSNVTLTFSEPANGIVEIKFIDYTGRVTIAQTHKVKKGRNNIRFDVSGLSEGVYSISVQNKDLKGEAVKISRFIRN